MEFSTKHQIRLTGKVDPKIFEEETVVLSQLDLPKKQKQNAGWRIMNGARVEIVSPKDGKKVLVVLR